MCGIAGFVELNGQNVQQSTMDLMSDSLRHRGPDSSGTYTFQNVGLGHRRLSIQDLTSAANQPMTSPTRRHTLIYNGEIYNFRELRQELRRLGHEFRSNSDTEVVLAAWEAWGAHAIRKFNGMFALAIFDQVNGVLTLARDRFGVKPLYYSNSNGRFIFASEQRAILSAMDKSPSLDLMSIQEYFTFQNFISGGTHLSGISTQEPGSILTLNVRSGNLEMTKYWEFDFESQESESSLVELVDELDSLLNQSVKRQIGADVEVGAYLSGGLDSSTIVSYANKNISDLKTFTIGFDTTNASRSESKFDERDEARKFSEHFQTNHFEECVSHKDFEQSLDNLVTILEEPRVGQSYPNFFAASLAASHVSVVLSGAGGDELFGGYPWRYTEQSKANSVVDFEAAYLKQWQRLLPPERLKLLLEPLIFQSEYASPIDLFRRKLGLSSDAKPGRERFFQAAFEFESNTFLQGLLFVEDKISMSMGLETRLPFLDNDLVNFAMRLPSRFKIGSVSESEPRNLAGKLLLRRNFQNRVRGLGDISKKQGFSAPDQTWFRKESKEFVSKRLGDRNRPLFNLISFPIAAEILSEHFSGKENHRLLIWSLLSFDSLLHQADFH